MPTKFAPKLPRLAGLLDEAETDVLACMSFPSQHRTKLHCANLIERLNEEINGGPRLLGIFPQ